MSPLSCLTPLSLSLLVSLSVTSLSLVSFSAALSAPYLSASRGGVSSPSSLSGPSVSVDALSVNSALTQSLEALCTRGFNRPDFFSQVEEHVSSIVSHCSSLPVSQPCLLASRVRGVRTHTLFEAIGVPLEEFGDRTDRERLRLNGLQFFDTNEDFRISFEEHVEAMCLMQQQQQSADGRPAIDCEDPAFVRSARTEFDGGDRNHNGFIDYSEFGGVKEKEEYRNLRLPFTRSPVTVPVFSFLLEVYHQTYHYSVRQLLLLLAQVMVRIEPSVADLQQDPVDLTPATSGRQLAGGSSQEARQPVRISASTQLGLVPAPFHAMVSFPLDLVLTEAILRRGAGSFSVDSGNEPNQLRPFLLTSKAWPFTGSAARDTEPGRRTNEIKPPVGLSFLSQLRMSRNDDTTVGIVKVMFMAMDAVNGGHAVSTADGFWSMTTKSTQLVRSDQGHAFNVVYQSLHSVSPAFREWEAALDAQTDAPAVIHRPMALEIAQDCNTYLLRRLVPALKSTISPMNSVNSSASNGANDGATGLAVPEASLVEAQRRLVDSITPTSTHAPAGAADSETEDLPFGYTIDLRELLVSSLDAGRNILHDIGIAGHAQLMDTICEALMTDQLDMSAERRAFLTAMKVGATRLGRTPLHYASLWYGEGETFQALLRCVEAVGGDTKEYLDFTDTMGFTPAQYAVGAQQVDLHEDTETIDRLYNAVVDADEATGMKKPEQVAERNQQRIGKPKKSSWLSVAADAKTQIARAASDDLGGWDFVEPASDTPFGYLHTLPAKPKPNNAADATAAMGALLGTGSRSLGVQVFEGMPTRKQMLAVVNSHRPAVFRGALLDLGANRSVWSKTEFLRHYGDTMVTIADIPYRSTFSSLINGTGDERIRMRDYVEGFADRAHINEEGIPLYMFSASFTSENPRLNADCAEVLEFMNGLPGLQELHGGQFFVGPEGSGAPVHFHSSAVNALYYGRKRWVLIPPMQSFYSVKPAAAFFRDDIDAIRQNYDVYEFVQEAGDLAYVPDYYGHGTVNLEPSIGIAFEFENFNHKLFNTQLDMLRRTQSSVPGSYQTLKT